MTPDPTTDGTPALLTAGRSAGVSTAARSGVLARGRQGGGQDSSMFVVRTRVATNRHAALFSGVLSRSSGVQSRFS
jgi:hypothetical protein